VLAIAVIILAVSAEPAGQRYATFGDPHSQQVFRAGRQQLGGEASIEDLRAFVMKGLARTTDERGAPVARDVEIRVLLPDRYLRIETADGFERRTGFAGGELLSEIRIGSSVERPPRTWSSPSCAPSGFGSPGSCLDRCWPRRATCGCRSAGRPAPARCRAT